MRLWQIWKRQKISLKQLYAVDTTALHQKLNKMNIWTESKNYLKYMKEKPEAVKLVQEELSVIKEVTIAGREDVHWRQILSWIERSLSL